MVQYFLLLWLVSLLWGSVLWFFILQVIVDYQEIQQLTISGTISTQGPSLGSLMQFGIFIIIMGIIAIQIFIERILMFLIL